MENDKQYALITGGTGGIGYELAKLLAKDGYGIILVARGQEGLGMAASVLKAQGAADVVTISKDLFNAGNAIELAEEVKEKGLTVGILVNDAGQGQYGEFARTDIYRDLDIIQLNISSLVVLTHAFLNEMIGRGQGKILNLASVASKTPGPLQSVYHGTKAFVHSFTEAIRDEVKGSGVTVTSLMPGATATDFFNKADMLEAKNIKGQQLADPAQVAKDGYDALMSGDDKVVSGFKNKVSVAISNLLPDATVADRVHKQQAPSDTKAKK